MKTGASVRASVVLPNRYLDSVLLMRLSRQLSQQPGVLDASLVMGTDANRSRVVQAGYPRPEVEAAGPDDLLACVEASTREAATGALEQLERLIADASRSVSATSTARSMEGAVQIVPDAKIVVISVPGRFAAEEAKKALKLGLNPFIFSSNVDIQDEIALKQEAERRGLIVMGPDCGTAIISGVGLGFANAIRRGPVGVVGASGTGLQAMTTLVHRMGSGISHAIGVGSRDLSSEVGGISTLAALRALESDAATRVIVLVAKSATSGMKEAIAKASAVMSTPVIECYLDGGSDALESIAREAVEAAGIAPVDLGSDDQVPNRVPKSPRRYVRGLFAGGTFCSEARMIFMRAGVDPVFGGHSLIDMGSEEFTLDRPHPMIDPRFRCERLVEEAASAETAVLLFDVVLGFGAAADPAGDLVDALLDARRISRDEIALVASVCGTDLDNQDMERQIKLLREAGVTVMPTSARAAELALRVVGESP